MRIDCFMKKTNCKFRKDCAILGVAKDEFLLNFFSESIDLQQKINRILVVRSGRILGLKSYLCRNFIIFNFQYAWQIFSRNY